MEALQETLFGLDDSGKIDLNDIYNKKDPRKYFTTLRRLNYLIPQFAKPVFQRMIECRRDVFDRDHVKIVDLGCSYGINAALLKHDLEMEQLYRAYDSNRVAKLDRDAIIARDRNLFSEHVVDDKLEIVGCDTAANAIDYAIESHVLDDGTVADLEVEDVTSSTAEVIGNADLVISTGCIGYVGSETLTKIVETNEERKPWMAHFVLRMFPFDEIAEALRSHGYVTEKPEDQTFFQRRFASAAEQTEVLDRLSDLGIDPRGKEEDGWYHAELFISRPQAQSSLIDIKQISPV